MAFGGWLGEQVSNLGSSIDDAVNKLPGGWTTAALLAGGYYYYPEISAYVSGEGAVVPAAEGVTTGAAGVPTATASSLTGAQIASLAKAGISLAGIAGAANALDSGTGGLGLSQQDRSGFSSGSANYSPEYYQQIQSKYNQYMPQAKGADITTDLKNWYETKYTPQASIAAAPTTGTTGTGYTTPTTMTNLGIKPQVVAPSYSTLDPTKSTATDVGTEYAKFIAAAGGNTQANRDAAIQYLQTKGFSGPQIDAAYNQYLGTLPASTGTTAETMAANATPAQIAQAYAGYVQQQGGDTQATQEAAIRYLQQIGVPYATIEAAYPIFKSTYGQTTTAAAPTTAAPAATGGGGGMLTGGGSTAAPSQPSYTALTGSSSPAAIAAAYKDFVGGSGGDTQANQAAAIQYLSNLGVDQGTINQAYGLFKG